MGEITAVPGKRYLHKKGNTYVVLAIGTHTESHEEVVIYTLDPSETGVTDHTWVRPRDMFEDGRFTPLEG